MAASSAGATDGYEREVLGPFGQPRRRVESQLLPVDWLVATYNLLFAVIWLWNAARTWYAPLIGVAHLAGLSLPALLRSRATAESRAGSVLREVYPLILVAAFWTELDLVRPVLALASHDGAVAAWDRGMFGVHIHQVWMPRMSSLWFSELMYLSYEGYYLLVFLPPIVLALKWRRLELRDFTFRITLVYLICFIVYAAFPVDGPHFLEEPFRGPHVEGLFYRLNAMAQASGDSLGCSFPSSHVAAAVTSAFLSAKYFSRWIAVLMAFEALGITLATVYTQNHYAIDSLAGLLLALPLQVIIVPWLYRRFAARGWVRASRY